MLRKHQPASPKTGRWTASDVQRVLIELGFNEANLECSQSHKPPGFEVTVNTLIDASQEAPVPINAVLLFKQHKESIVLALMRLQMVLDRDANLTHCIQRYIDNYKSELFVDSVSMKRIIISSGDLFRKTHQELFK